MTAEAEITEKRSRFIGYIAPIDDAAQAKSELSRVKMRHRDARHNVWCYVLPDGSRRFSDDGEPQGSAGAPIAEMLERENIRGALCVVTRYFGGVLLGPGGLSRAYTAAAKVALDKCGLRQFTSRRRVETCCGYALAQVLRDAIIRAGGEIISTEYLESVVIASLLREDELPAYIQRVNELSAGTVSPEDMGEIMVPIDEY